MSKDSSEFGAFSESADWEKLARFLAGESSSEEAEEARRWLAEDPARQQLLDALRHPIERLAFRAPEDLDVEAALKQVTARMDSPDVLPLTPRAVRRPEWREYGWATGLRAAAVVLLVVGGALLLRSFTGGDPVSGAAAQSYATEAGERESLRLADGSRILLGPGSRLDVPAGYGEQSRTVNLSGEAFFEVADSDAPPFTVVAGKASVRDLGTAFTVRGGAEGGVQVVVTSGSVVLHPVDQPADRGVVLRAGDRGHLDPGASPVAARAAATEEDLAWTHGELVFRDTPLRQVSADLRRWYGIELRVAQPALAERRLTATFAGESRERVLEVIALTLGAEVVMRGDTAVLRAGGPR